MRKYLIWQIDYWKWNVKSELLYYFIAVFTAMMLLASLIGCASIQKGQDPLIVEAERVLTIGKGTLELVTAVDEANRAFWATNAPAYHQFVESLRQKVVFNETNIMRRGPAILVSLDNIKLQYKASKASSNALITAIATGDSVLREAQMWLATVNTNSIPR